MNDIVENTPVGSAKTAEELAGLKNLTTAVYALQALSFLFGITFIVAIVINYVKREDVRGTLYESHFEWQIKTFWWGLLWMVVGLITAVILVGFVVLAAASVWVIYRIVKGWLKLNEGKTVAPA